MQEEFLIVVPVLDEAAALPAVLAELKALDLLERTIFVDNGSLDGGPELIRSAGGELLCEPRRGYGYPCLAGARAAQRRRAIAVVFMEADGTDDPAQVRELVGPVLAGRADLVLGSRRQAVLGRAAGRMPFHQRVGNAWLGLNLRLFFGLPLSDDAPFRCVRLELLEDLQLEERAYAFPSEMAVKARLAGARITIRDVAYRPRYGRSKIAGSWRASLGAVRDITWCLLRLRLRCQ